MKSNKLALLTALVICTTIFIFFINLQHLSKQLKTCLPPNDLNKVSTCLDQVSQLEPLLRFTNKFSFLKEIKPFLPFKDYLLGTNKPVTYLILLQNDTEIRANGGFFGSYAKLNLTPTTASISFHDIYTPDGQLEGHVNPPLPIQSAFGQGWFKLRDADWEPSFPVSATTIRWFLTKGKEVNPDVLITLSLSTIQDILKITGPITLENFNLTLDSENAFLTLQNLVEKDFFPGSTQKKDTLTAAGQALIQKLSSLPPTDLLSIAKLFLHNIKNQNILFNSTNPSLQQLFLSQNWAGELKPATCLSEGCLNDGLTIIEANLGANKANCCVVRHTTHIITKENNYLTHQINLNYQNNSPTVNLSPSIFFGGDYLNYIRFYLPAQAQNLNITTSPSNNKDQLSVKNKYGFQEIGFFHLTKASDQSSISLSYQLPTTNQKSYQLTIFKQHGLISSPQTINLFGKDHTTNLNQDYTAPKTPIITTTK